MTNRTRTRNPGDVRGQQAGFSLIEVLIIVAIVVVIAVIAVPNLVRSKVAANEASAIGSLRNIMSSETAYKAMYGTGYSNDLGSLGGTSTDAEPGGGQGQPSCTAAQLLDVGLSKNVVGNKTQKSGYQFTFAPGREPFKADQAASSGCEVGKADGYAVQADPADPGAGRRHFCADASGVIRFDVNREIDVTAAACAGSAAPLQ